MTKQTTPSSYKQFYYKEKWAVSWQNQQNDLCAQRRLRSACVSAQFDQSLRCPPKQTLGPQLPIERTAKTLIRLGRCPGWSESLLGAHAILLVVSWCGSNVILNKIIQRRGSFRNTENIKYVHVHSSKTSRHVSPEYAESKMLVLLNQCIDIVSFSYIISGISVIRPSQKSCLFQVFWQTHWLFGRLKSF